MAAPVKPGFLTDALEHRHLDWEDKRCAVVISGTSRVDETRFRHRFFDELEVNPKNGLDAYLPTCPLKRSVSGSAFGTQAGHCLVVAFCSIDNAALVISVCRPCSVVNVCKELRIPLLRDASGEYYLLDSFLFKMVRLKFKLVNYT